MSRPDRDSPSTAPGEFVRDPLANPAAIIAARERSMAERLELAISWNKVASELREGMVQATQQGHSQTVTTAHPQMRRDAGRAAPESKRRTARAT